MTDFTVIKCDAFGTEVLRYTGEVIFGDDISVCIRAIFQFSTRDLGYVVLKQGDIFTEWFYRDRYYNVFRVEDVDSGALKGWYCNITRPAHISHHEVSADDLVLDVFVKPDRTTLLLDENEFAALSLPEAERRAAWEAVATIQRLAADYLPPFDV